MSATPGLPVIAVTAECAEATSVDRVAIDDIARMGVDACERLLAEELPHLGVAMASVGAVLDAAGMCLLRGVPTRADAVLALMATVVGDLVPATDRPRTFLEDITPIGEGEPSGRPHSQRRSALMPHTDQSARAFPPGFLVLACVINDAGGGESVLVPAEPAVRHLALLEPRLVELLQDPVFPLFNVPKRDFAVTAPLVWFDDDGSGAPGHGAVRTRFREEAVRAGLLEMNRPSDDHVAAFEALAGVYHDEAWWLVQRLEPGDVLFFDNTRVLHGRKEVHGEQRRHLKRLNGHFRRDHVDRHPRTISHAAPR